MYVHYVYIYIYIYIERERFTHASTYMYTCVYMYIYIHTYIYIYILHSPGRRQSELATLEKTLRDEQDSEKKYFGLCSAR